MTEARGQGGGGWTIGLLIIGLAAVAACAIVPQLDANRRLAYERLRLQADLDQINKQTAVNEQFLAKLESDPQLAQRLAQRQMKFIRQGESILSFKSPQAVSVEMSPYSLVQIPAPPALAAYQPAGGMLSRWLLDAHYRLYCMAGGLFLVAMAIVFGANDPLAATSD